MLKKIAVTDLRLGMHLHGFEGAWLDHPFWRTRFTIDDAAVLKTVQSSGVGECWIDIDKGLDVAAVAAAAGATSQPSPQRPAHGPRLPAAARATAAPTGDAGRPGGAVAAEMQRAAVLCHSAKSAVASMFAEVRMGRALDARQCLPLVNEISDSVMRNPGALISLARLKTADDYSYLHSVAVCALMVALGRTLGFDDDACREAGLAGMLHDMGKALMPIEILNKPGKLTDEEFEIVRRHPEQGWALLRDGQGVGQPVLDVCLHHHERIDGSGYPHRLDGERISLLARMGAVCDVYDAITSNRPYKAGWDPGLSIARMATWQGHFDPPVFAAFVKSLGIYPTGSLVRLVSGKLAVVVAQNAQSLLLPTVKAFFSTRTDLPIPVQEIDLANSSERIASREPRAAWSAPLLERLWAADLVTS